MLETDLVGPVRITWVTQSLRSLESEMKRLHVPAMSYLLASPLPIERSCAVDPEAAAYDALEEEFALAAALIEARSRADMTQEEVAQKMATTQAVIARLEGGSHMPSTRTLKKFAEATGTRLGISFPPENAPTA